MIGSSLTSIVKFFIGILLVQSATGMLVFAALRTEKQELWMLFILLALTLCLLTALWFASLVSHARRDARSQLQENFSREREKIRLKAEREKSKVIEKSHQRIIRDRSLTQAKSTIKSGAWLGGVLILGGIMIFTQFFTFGLLLMATAGGGLGGYLLHARQYRLTRPRKPLPGNEKGVEQITQEING